jgi:hypothetical protein
MILCCFLYYYIILFYFLFQPGQPKWVDPVGVNLIIRFDPTESTQKQTIEKKRGTKQIKSGKNMKTQIFF